jgi:hypothetical protein
MHVGYTSLLIDRLYRLYNCLEQDFREISEDKRIYEILFNIIYYSTTGLSFTTKDLFKNVRFTCTLYSAKKLLDSVFDVYNRYKASLAYMISEVYRVAISKLILRSKVPKYVILCDGMSIIETIYISYKIRPVIFIGIAINPGGVTETYKFILQPHDYLSRDKSLTLEEIAQQIASEVGGESQVFREFDDIIHRSKATNSHTIIKTMYNIVSRLAERLFDLKREFNASIMLISDHGYDVIQRNSDIFELQHRWNPRALSILSPILVL